MTDTLYLDALIVGQGLAGTLLAAELIGRGLRVMVIDDGHRSSSTYMAAGLLNPVTGMRLTRIRQADRFIPQALQTYRGLEQTWGTGFYHAKPLLRIFRTERQRSDWLERRRATDYQAYLDAPLEQADIPVPIDAPFGGGLQHQTGYLDTPVFLAAGRQWLIHQSALRETGFDWSGVELREDHARWHDLTARCIISCEGYRGQQHPWFGWLPFRPCKGQILTLETRDRLPDVILNRGTWLVPVGGGRARIGATYERDAVESGPTAAARQQLMVAARELFAGHIDWQLAGEAAGVRPGTRDKMPLVGLHPEHAALGMFNGFGSKGVMMAPFYARRMADALQHATPVPDEVSLMRWWNPHAG